MWNLGISWQLKLFNKPNIRRYLLVQLMRIFFSAKVVDTARERPWLGLFFIHPPMNRDE